MLNPTYSTALLLVAALFALVAITPQIVPHTGLTEPRDKATAAACIRQTPKYQRATPGNGC
jgi:hypothetical protein